MSDQATLGGTDGASSPLPQPGRATFLITPKTLSQDFNAAISTPVSVQNARRAVFDVSYVAHASATDGYAQILVMVSNAAAPAIGDDSWFALPVYDAEPTDVDIAAAVTLPTGADFTKGPNWRAVKGGGLLLQTMPASSGEKVRQRFVLDVTDARWMYVAACQQGDTTNFGDFAALYSLSL